MKQTVWCLILVLLTSVFAGCGSPTIDLWADRGVEGVNNGKDNISVFTDALEEQLERQKNSDIDAVFEDILEVAEGRVPDTEIDEQWIEEHKAGLKLLLDAWEQDARALRDAKVQALGNMDQIAETFEQIKRLRRVWSQTEELQVQVDRLTNLVLRLIQDREGN